MYCMDVASTIAKLPFSISTVTLRYGEDDMSNLYSCISMCATYRAQDITLLQNFPVKHEHTKIYLQESCLHWIISR